MKKITTLLLLLVAALVVVMPTFADEATELVDIYPYDDPGALYGPSTPFTLVGDSNWDMEFLGYRYHFVRGGARFAHLWTDADADGIYAPTDYPALDWNAFAVMTFNDSPDEIELSTTSARTDITSVVQRIYSYFNADNELAMFEDHIFTYYIHNDGTDTTYNADWRLATDAEKAAFDAAEAPLVDTPKTRLTHVRIIRDETDSDGYVLEPIGYLGWRNPDLTALTGDDAVPEAEQSLLVDWNPNHVVIPAGWTVVSFGTNDRGAYSSTDFIKLFAATFKEAQAPKMVSVYSNPGVKFNGLATQDDDLGTPGIQIIVDHNASSFNLSNAVTVTSNKMFDASDAIINEVENLDYQVDIYDSVDFNSAEEDHEPTILETIKFTYNSDDKKYVASGAVSKVDTSVFGGSYIAVYTTEHPVLGVTRVEVTISVGTLPPKFENVKTRYADESMFVDLLGNITANDGYGNDKTSDIVITPPALFNIYNPKPGTHEIKLEFKHTVEVLGNLIPSKILIGETLVSTTVDNPTVQGTLASNVTLYTQSFTHTSTGYAALTIVHFDKDGKMIQSVSRTDWKMWNEAGEGTLGSDALIKNWLESIDFSDGAFVVFFGNAGRVQANALRFGDTVTLTKGYREDPTFIDIITKTSYNLVVDDKTAPQVLVVDNNYTIESDQYASAEAAILANIVGVDNYDSRSQLSTYVIANGGLAAANGKLIVGTYTVTVAAEDRAGNVDEATFTVTVKAAKPTQQEVDQKVDEKVDEVEANIPLDTITPDQVDEAIKDALGSYDGVSVLTAVLMSLGAALVSFGGAALLFFLKKK